MAPSERLAREIERLEPGSDRVSLSDVRIGFACKQRWDDMVGDDRVRACGGCNRSVFNLSAMTRAEAEAVLATHGLTPCVRFYRRPDGTVMTTDCPTSPRRGARRLAVIASSLAAGATLALAPTAAADPPPPESTPAAATTSTGITIEPNYQMGIPVGRTFGEMLGAAGAIVVKQVEKRPVLEWSVWGRLGMGIASQRTDAVARSVTVPAPAAGSTSTTTWEAAAVADLTIGVARAGDLRLGAWGEVRTTSGPVAGGELVLEGLPPRPSASRIGGAGSLVLRAGANARIITGALGFGYVGSWPHPQIRWARHEVGARIVLSVNRALDEPHDWSATIGLEVEPIGAIHALLDLVRGR